MVFIHHCHKVLLYDELATGNVCLADVLVALLFALFSRPTLWLQGMTKVHDHC